MDFAPAELKHSIQAFDHVLLFTQPAEAVLSGYFTTHRKTLGKVDRARVASVVFTALRHLVQYRACYGEDVSSEKIIFATLVEYFDAPVEKTASYLNLKKDCLLDKIINTDASVMASGLPSWVILQLGGVLEHIVPLGQALQHPAPLDVRVNTRNMKRAQALEILCKDGIAALPTPYSPIGLRLPIHTTLKSHPLFLAGTLEVQDEGSQLVGLLIEAKRHEKIIDFCAGAGGKTLQLGAQMASTGRLYAWDVAKTKLIALKERVQRAGLTNVTAQWIHNEKDAKLIPLYRKMDRVLVDVPCSGLGTLRRHPDLIYRHSASMLTQFALRQFEILKAASCLVKPGGRLVYATCSFLPCENEAVVERFLSIHPTFEVVSAQSILRKQEIDLTCGDFLHLTPHQHNTDGFFAAVLRLIP